MNKATKKQSNMKLKTRSHLLCCLSLLAVWFSDDAFAQSVFSRRGVGLLRQRDNVRAIGMGGVGIALNDSISFYFLNPASLTPVNLTRIQGDFRYERASVNLVQSAVSGLFQDGGVNSLGLAIPITSGQVIAFGVRPYSFSNFQFTREDSAATESLSSFGGISELYLGYARQLGAWRFGATADFYFGRLERIWRLNHASDEIRNSEDVVNRQVTGVGLHLGAQLQPGRWRFGSAIGLPARLNVTTELNTLPGFTGVISKSKLKLPFWWSAGFGYAPNRRWLFSADYRTQRWGSVQPEELLGDRGTNSFALSFGGEFIPSFDALEGYLKRVSYRFGGNYQQLPYEEPAGKKVRQLTVNFGLGLPFGRGYNRFDLAVELGKRGSLTDNLVKENIVMVHVGITGSERWFQRPKRR
jgi:hypothetical protein